MAITTCVFDAYGTLFDVSSAARELAATNRFPILHDKWPAIAREWRQRQLSYTWLRAAGGHHADFWAVTKDALDVVLEVEAINDPALRDALLDLYRRLSAYPEVPLMLEALKARGFHTAILSNGSPQMLEDAVSAAGIGGALDALLSVEGVGVFKPDPRVYDLVGAHFGCKREEVLFVSSNGWDANASAGYGFQTAWVNRANEPQEKLWATPHHVLSDLTTIPQIAGA